MSIKYSVRSERVDCHWYENADDTINATPKVQADSCVFGEVDRSVHCKNLGEMSKEHVFYDYDRSDAHYCVLAFDSTRLIHDEEAGTTPPKPLTTFYKKLCEKTGMTDSISSSGFVFRLCMPFRIRNQQYHGVYSDSELPLYSPARIFSFVRNSRDSLSYAEYWPSSRSSIQLIRCELSKSKADSLEALIRMSYGGHFTRYSSKEWCRKIAPMFISWSLTEWGCYQKNDFEPEWTQLLQEDTLLWGAFGLSVYRIDGLTGVNYGELDQVVSNSNEPYCCRGGLESVVPGISMLLSPLLDMEIKKHSFDQTKIEQERMKFYSSRDFWLYWNYSFSTHFLN